MSGMVTALTTADPERPLLLFVHIPKASGTTLRHIIQRQYPAGAVYRTTDPSPAAIAKALRELQNASDVQCVAGHMEFGLHRYLTRPARYITMLRHPVPRLVSHYEFVRRTPDHFLHDRVLAEGITLDEYVTRALTTEINDGQVRLLCGLECATNVGYGEVSEEMFEAARLNLRNHFLAVGITERFDESLLLFGAVLGWRSLAYAPVNTRPARRAYAISESTKELIVRYNRFDVRLYDDACELLQTALSNHGIDAMKLALLRARNVAHRAGRRGRSLLGRASAAMKRGAKSSALGRRP